MPKASEVANELRKLADGLDKDPDALVQRPFVYFSHYGAAERSSFLAYAKAFPHPLTKKYEGTDLRIEHCSESIHIMSKINRDAICRLIAPARPAVYECEPLLSEEDHAALGVE